MTEGIIVDCNDLKFIATEYTIENGRLILRGSGKMQRDKIVSISIDLSNIEVHGGTLKVKCKTRECVIYGSTELVADIVLHNS